MLTVDITLKRARRLRRPMTPQELGLWRRVKNRQLDGFKFRRQHPIGPYILDFYCAEMMTPGATPISKRWGSGR